MEADLNEKLRVANEGGLEEQRLKDEAVAALQVQYDPCPYPCLSLSLSISLFVSMSIYVSLTLTLTLTLAFPSTPPLPTTIRSTNTIHLPLTHLNHLNHLTYLTHLTTHPPIHPTAHAERGSRRP